MVSEFYEAQLLVDTGDYFPTSKIPFVYLELLCVFMSG